MEVIKSDVADTKPVAGSWWHAIVWFFGASIFCLFWNAFASVAVEIGLNVLGVTNPDAALLPSLLLWLLPVGGVKMMRTQRAKTGWLAGWGFKLFGSLYLFFVM